MKRLKLLTILFIGIIILTGCSKAKKSITAVDFYNTADKAGLVLQDASNVYGLAKKAYQSTINDYQYTIFFIEGNSISDMQNMFLDEAANIYSKTGLDKETETVEPGTLTTKGAKKSTGSGKNWKSLEVSTEDRYYYVTFIDNTLLYIESNNTNKDKLISIKDTIKY